MDCPTCFHEEITGKLFMEGEGEEEDVDCIGVGAKVVIDGCGSMLGADIFVGDAVGSNDWIVEGGIVGNREGEGRLVGIFMLKSSIDSSKNRYHPSLMRSSHRASFRKG